MGKIWMPGGGSGADLDAITAEAGDVLTGKVIVDKDGNTVTGTMASMPGQTITPGASQKTVSCSGKYMTGNVVINGDSNLVAANILSGKTIFGIAGSAKEFKSRSGTVTSSTTTKAITISAGWNPGSMYYASIPTGFTVELVVWTDGLIVGWVQTNIGHAAGHTVTDGGDFITFNYTPDSTWYINSSGVMLPCKNKGATCWYIITGY